MIPNQQHYPTHSITTDISIMYSRGDEGTDVRITEGDSDQWDHTLGFPRSPYGPLFQTQCLYW